MNMQNVTRQIRMIGLVIKKHSPEIMMVAGVAGGVTATVMACKETLRLEETLDECKEKIHDLEVVYAENEEYEEDAFKKDKAIQTVKNAVEVAKLYAPSVVVGAASVGLIFGSNDIMRKRNASLAAAYATLDNMYRRYRENVKDTFGEAIDKDMRYGITHETCEKEITDEKGKTKKVDEVVEVITTPNGYSDYARFFDESCLGWDKNPEYNLMYLKGIQEYCNNLLKANGYLFLNDVYAAIGIDKSIAGQTVGWIYDKENPCGDNYIDFGLYRDNDKAVRRFINGYENVILLDFNVDGDILHSPKLKLWSF